MIRRDCLRMVNRHWVYGTRQLNCASSCKRSLSSVPFALSANPRPPIQPISNIQKSWRPQRLPFQRLRHQPVPRFASTVADASPVADIQADTVSLPQNSIPAGEDFTVSSFDDVTSSIGSPAYEHLGFLKEMGLDYGWGPTSMLETLLEHVYIYTGLPWWASIAATMFTIRAVLLKFYVDAADVSARNQTVAEYNQPIMDRYTAASAAGDRHELMKAAREMKDLRAAAGIKLWKLAIPLVQIPVGFATFRLLRGMSNLPVPGFESGGALWFSDLTIADPYFFFPLATAASYYYTFKVGGETGAASTMGPAAKRVFLYVFPTLSGVIMLAWPSGLQLTFFIGAMISMIQTAAFRQPGIRHFLGIQPLPPTAQDKSKTPAYSGVINKYQSSSAAGAVPDKSKGILGGALSDVSNAASEIMKTAQKMMPQQQQKAKAQQRTKAELKHAKAYEDRKRREEAQARFERQQEREARTREKTEEQREKLKL